MDILCRCSPHWILAVGIVGVEDPNVAKGNVGAYEVVGSQLLFREVLETVNPHFRFMLHALAEDSTGEQVFLIAHHFALAFIGPI